MEIEQFYQQVVKPKLWPHQRMLVVPGLYGNNTATAAEVRVAATHVENQTRVLIVGPPGCCWLSPKAAVHDARLVLKLDRSLQPSATDIDNL